MLVGEIHEEARGLEKVYRLYINVAIIDLMKNLIEMPNVSKAKREEVSLSSLLLYICSSVDIL